MVIFSICELCNIGLEAAFEHNDSYEGDKYKSEVTPVKTSDNLRFSLRNVTIFVPLISLI
jgi:hypothetical protein